MRMGVGWIEVGGIDYEHAALAVMKGAGIMRAAKFRKWAHKFGCRFMINGVKLVE